MDTMLWTALGLAIGVVTAAVVVWALQRHRNLPGTRPVPASSAGELSVDPLIPIKRSVAAESPAEIVFGPSEGAAALKIGAWVGSIPSSAQRLDAEASRIRALEPILLAAPNVLTAAAIGGDRYMKVVVDGSLAAAGDGSFLPFVRGADGSVMELARLHDPTALNALVNAAAIWQVATVVVAQKHLADINQQLREINDALADVVRFQKENQRARVTSAVKYFQELAEVLGSGEVVRESRQKLEDHYSDLTEIQLHLQTELSTLIRQIPAIKGTDRVGSEDLFRQMELHNEKIAAAICDWKQCVGARLMSWYLLMCYAGEKQTKVTRLHAIEESINSFRIGNDGLAGISPTWKDKIDKASAFWNRASTLETRRAALHERVSQSDEIARNASASMHTIARKGADALRAVDGPLEMAIRLRPNGGVEAWLLSDEQIC
jgi:hypothetical protein